jgi:hypothetical protein
MTPVPEAAAVLQISKEHEKVKIDTYRVLRHPSLQLDGSAY